MIVDNARIYSFHAKYIWVVLPDREGLLNTDVLNCFASNNFVTNINKRIVSCYSSFVFLLKSIVSALSQFCIT